VGVGLDTRCQDLDLLTLREPLEVRVVKNDHVLVLTSLYAVRTTDPALHDFTGNLDQVRVIAVDLDRHALGYAATLTAARNQTKDDQYESKGADLEPGDADSGLVSASRISVRRHLTLPFWHS